MKALILMVLLTGCGVDHRVKGNTQSQVVAEAHVAAEVEIVLKIDLSTCDEFVGKDKLQCIEDITGVFDALGDLSKVLICPPDQTKTCDLLSSILGKT